MWNEAKWVCWFAPFCEPPRDTCYSGTAPILHDAEVLRDVLTVGAYHFVFWFFLGAGRVCSKNRLSVWKPRATPPPHPLPWGLFFCYVGAVVFSDQKHLRALFSPKPPSLLLDWREPQRGRAKTTQRASDRKAKQIGGAPFFFASASGEVT